jgi:hypothetical protein
MVLLAMYRYHIAAKKDLPTQFGRSKSAYLQAARHLLVNW